MMGVAAVVSVVILAIILISKFILLSRTIVRLKKVESRLNFKESRIDFLEMELKIVQRRCDVFHYHKYIGNILGYSVPQEFRWHDRLGKQELVGLSGDGINSNIIFHFKDGLEVKEAYIIFNNNNSNNNKKPRDR